MSNIWHDLSPSRVNPDDFIAVSRLKRVQKTNMSWTRRPANIILDRILYTSTHYPATTA